ncbi:hypothetical protein AVEN_146068-1 [Araneus ventricosus]|uniref:Uncharacterized protein n=1 Tax=Araneus ventricosus TaxID=182803 RepID=A0A4Y2LG40_ARAVE|nr:hypothetical protein AVEN_146068-1 [Araneus ventricosus]
MTKTRPEVSSQNECAPVPNAWWIFDGTSHSPDSQLPNQGSYSRKPPCTHVCIRIKKYMCSPVTYCTPRLRKLVCSAAMDHFHRFFLLGQYIEGNNQDYLPPLVLYISVTSSEFNI